MKKQLLATFVGGIILFVWQFLSWAAIPIHKSEYGYTPNQDRIMEALNQNLTEEGTYMLPGIDPAASREQVEASMKSNEGKPWASISYHKSMSNNMGMNMFRGFVVDLVAAYLMIWLLMKMENLTMRTALQTSVGIGFIAYLTIPYLNSIWFEGNTLEHLIDVFGQWGILGLWLGWWLPRK